MLIFGISFLFIGIISIFSKKNAKALDHSLRKLNFEDVENDNEKNDESDDKGKIIHPG